jgi:exosortase A-associated hydrolase 1
MSYQEQAVLFDCAGERMVGIVSQPVVAGAPGKHPMETGVVIVVGGPQYRVGSHRQFLRLARGLASAGYAVMRFDVRGMGDSSGELRSFELITADIGAAIDTLQQCVPQVRRVALWGLCDGASAALLYWQETSDARVGGLCLLNPWVRSEASLARTQVKHYYMHRLQQREFWAKLISGQVAWKGLTGLARNLRTALRGQGARAHRTHQPFQDRMAAAWHNFDGPILLLLSGADYTAREFLEYAGTSQEWANALRRKQLIRHDEPEADHTFSQRRFDAVVERCTLDLLARQGVASTPFPS